MGTIFLRADKRMKEAGFEKVFDGDDFVHYIFRNESGVFRLELYRDKGVRYFQHVERNMDQSVLMPVSILPHILRKYKEKGWKLHE